MPIARVVTDLSADREFDYAIPPSLEGRVHRGSRVQVPFRNGVRSGYVVGFAETSEFPNLRTLHSVEDDTRRIPETLLRLARWMADYYCCSHEQAVRAVLPASVRAGKVSRKTRKTVTLIRDDEVDLAASMEQLERRAPKQAAALRFLITSPHTPADVVSRRTGADLPVMRRLARRGLVRIEESEVDRDPFGDEVILPTTPLALTPAQTHALTAINQSIAAQDGQVFLLHGVTGSGKTEVYLQAIDGILARGRDAVVLVPEISLTPQTTDRFRARFGEVVSVLHSGLSDGQRFDEWLRCSQGRARIVIGARSALFAPFRNLGLIVVDEEHETTYKQEEAPRYCARDVAVIRGKFESAAVVLGSATPAMESLLNCRRSKYRLLQLPERVDAKQMPAMELVDMSAEAASRGGAQVFSRHLESLVRDRLERGEQTILFLNRRGYATQMMCEQCGYVAVCPDCSVSYTYHRRDRFLACHLCGKLVSASKTCPQCEKDGVRYGGVGTEKVESIARRLFPGSVVRRMDSDTMGRRDSYRTVLEDFRAGRVQILVGTQMIAKGLHFPNVTLVGIIFADMSLHIPDFRAAERTYQLLTQVAGRAGRGDVPGRVVVQSYTPGHRALQFALDHDSEGFAEYELAQREAQSLPPFSHMLAIHFSGKDRDATQQVAEQLYADLAEHLPSGTDSLPPMPSPLEQIRNRFRFQTIYTTPRILALTRALRPHIVGRRSRGVRITVDVDPFSLA